MNTPLQNRIIAYYNQTALEYSLAWMNSKNRAMHFGYYEPGIKSHADSLLNSNRVMAHKAGVKSGDRVLDAGCGQGGSACWLAANAGAEVVGVTLVPKQVQMAQAFSKELGLEQKVRFELQDYTATTFPDASFDVVWACESLCHAPEKKAFYKEAFRLLKPGGRLVAFECVRSRRPLSDEGERMLREFLDGWAMPGFDTREEHLSNMTSAGFVDAKVEDITPNMLRSLRRAYLIIRFSRPYTSILRLIGIRSDVLRGNEIASQRQYESVLKNYWFYSCITAKKI